MIRRCRHYNRFTNRRFIGVYSRCFRINLADLRLHLPRAVARRPLPSRISARNDAISTVLQLLGSAYIVVCCAHIVMVDANEELIFRMRDGHRRSSDVDRYMDGGTACNSARMITLLPTVDIRRQRTTRLGCCEYCAVTTETSVHIRFRYGSEDMVRLDVRVKHIRHSSRTVFLV